jgi:hypothetical protein
MSDLLHYLLLRQQLPLRLMQLQMEHLLLRPQLRLQ